MAESFYNERNMKNMQKIVRLLDDLPVFCRQYFVGIENTTSTLTRLNYAYDLRLYFVYVCKYIYPDTPLRSISLKQLEEITAADIEGYLSFLSCYEKEDGSIECCNEKGKARKLSSVKSMYRYFFNKDKISVDNSSKVAAPKLHQKEIVRLDQEEVTEMLEISESGMGLTKRQKSFHEKTKVRDSAIITLFLGTGIRISELVGLNNDDIDLGNLSFVVTRKGGNRMILYYSEEVAKAIADYLDEKDEMIKKYKQELKKTTAIPQSKYDENALFLSSQGNRISIRAVECLVGKYAKIVTPTKKISPHKLRSTYGTNLYDETRDIYVVADVLGHKDVNTTKKHYANISDKVRREASTKVKLRQEKDDD